MTDNQLRILQMLENGTINATQAAELLNALQDEPIKNDQTEMIDISEGNENKKRAKWLRILVTDSKTDKKKVNIRVPMALIHLFGKSQMLKNIHIGNGNKLDLDENMLDEALNNGEPGIIVDVEDEDDGEHVLIALE